LVFFARGAPEAISGYGRTASASGASRSTWRGRPSRGGGWRSACWPRGRRGPTSSCGGCLWGGWRARRAGGGAGRRGGGRGGAVPRGGVDDARTGGRLVGRLRDLDLRQALARGHVLEVRIREDRHVVVRRILLARGLQDPLALEVEQHRLQPLPAAGAVAAPQ